MLSGDLLTIPRFPGPRRPSPGRYVGRTTEPRHRHVVVAQILAARSGVMPHADAQRGATARTRSELPFRCARRTAAQARIDPPRPRLASKAKPDTVNRPGSHGTNGNDACATCQRRHTEILPRSVAGTDRQAAGARQAANRRGGRLAAPVGSAGGERRLPPGRCGL